MPVHITEELAKAGATLIETGIGGSHPFIRFSIAGQTRKFVYPGTPGDHRSMLNNRCELRRLIRRVVAEADERLAAKAA